MNQGWSCPGCGKCYSPTTPQCFTCGQPSYTSNNTGGLFSNQMGKFEKDVGFGCVMPMDCKRKNGHCPMCDARPV